MIPLADGGGKTYNAVGAFDIAVCFGIGSESKPPEPDEGSGGFEKHGSGGRTEKLN
jgi:hypothetical protein